MWDPSLSPCWRKSYDSASFPGVLFRVTPPIHFPTNLTAVLQYGIQTGMWMPHPFLGKYILKLMKTIIILPSQKATTVCSTLCTTNQRTYLKLQRKLSDNMPTSAQAEAETIFSEHLTGIQSFLCWLSCLYCIITNPRIFVPWQKKCCNSVRAILLTLGSKNAKQESPL